MWIIWRPSASKVELPRGLEKIGRASLLLTRADMGTLDPKDRREPRLPRTAADLPWNSASALKDFAHDLAVPRYKAGALKKRHHPIT
jgi:hypothetical protein